MLKDKEATKLWIHSGFLFSSSTTQENIASLYNRPDSNHYYKVRNVEFFNYVPRNLDPAIYMTKIADGEFDSGAWPFPMRLMAHWQSENPEIIFYWKNAHNFLSYYGINGWFMQQYLFKDTTSYAEDFIIEPGCALSFAGASQAGQDFLVTVKIIVEELV